MSSRDQKSLNSFRFRVMRIGVIHLGRSSIEEESYYHTGFLGASVFRVEATEGEPLDYERLEVPPLPLLEVAQTRVSDTQPVGSGNGLYGCFVPDRQFIYLASTDWLNRLR